MDTALLDRAGVAAGLGITTKTLDRIRRNDLTFPNPLRLSPQVIRWRGQDIDRWLADQAHRTTPTPAPSTGRKRTAEELYR